MAHRPLPHQGEDEGEARRAGGRNERPHLLRRPLLRLWFDDALYAACRLLEIVAASGRPLSAQLAGLPKMVSTPEIRVDCPDEVKFEVVERVAEAFKRTHNVVDVDGVRVLFEHGWDLVRASNTQPVLVMRFDAANESLLAQYRSEVEAALEQAKTQPA